jgi:hypothetical protein
MDAGWPVLFEFERRRPALPFRGFKSLRFSAFFAVKLALAASLDLGAWDFFLAHPTIIEIDVAFSSVSS